MNIPKIKMLILDVDGTMTDNGIYIDENGVESKRYNAKDGVGIYELIKNNIKIGIISHSEKGDGIKSRASYLGIKYCYVGNEPKDKILLEWMNQENITKDNIAFIGDDINDLPLLKSVGLSALAGNSPIINKFKPDYITKRYGGDGAYREFIEIILKA